MDDQTLGSVFGKMIGPAWSDFKPLADIAAIASPAEGEDLSQIDGLQVMGPIDLVGMWAPNSAEDFTIHGRLRDLPRKDKKLLKKLWARRPIGRRERVRGIRFTAAGVKMRLLPD